MSRSRFIQQGVPQGSTLGPLFYIIYANDIINDLNGQVALYADDTVLYSSAKKTETIERSLQRDMDTLAQWCRNNQLTINTKKTKVMIVGNKKDRERMGEIGLKFEGEEIEIITTYNYLGVKLDQNLS